MSRIVLPRCLAVLTLGVGLCLFSPVWAAGSNHPQPAAPAPAAAPHEAAGEMLRHWFDAVLAKLGIGSHGQPIRIDAGICIDPNGGCK